MITTRAATPDDAAAGARCQLACWREAYVDLADADRLAALLADEAGRADLWRRILDGPEHVRIALDDSEIVGFAMIGSAGPDDAPGTERIVHAVYVRQAYWGGGVGRRLLTETLGDASASLWVFRDNDRAVQFYRRHGFAVDGTTHDDEQFGGAVIRMVRILPSST